MDETDDTKWKRFYPADSSDPNLRTRLWVKYDKPPNAPTPQALSTVTDCYVACVSPAVVRTTQPTLKAAVSDPFNGNLRTVFEVRTAPSDTAPWVTDNAAAPVTTGSPGTATWTVPPNNLVNATTYSWRARSTDENNLTGAWSAWQTLSVDTAPPGVSSVGSTQYPYKQWGAVVTTPGSFTLSTGSDVHEFTWWVDGGATTTVSATGTNPKTATAAHTPATDMVHTLHAKAKDVAGNTGSTYDHQFWVSPAPNRCWNWRLDETSGTTAADKGNTDPADVGCAPIGATISAMPGALSGSVAFAAGYRNNGASFTGTGGQVLTSAPVLNTSQSFTVMAWVKPTDLSAAAQQTVIGQDGANASRFMLRFDQSASNGSGGWCMAVRASDSTTAAVTSACADGATWGTPSNGTWVHLAGVYDATTAKIRVYVMGDPQSCGGESTEATVSGAWVASGPLAVGRAHGSTTDSWRGMVDQVYAHQRVLSAAQICQQALQ